MINTNPLKIPIIKATELKPLPGMKSLYFQAETGNLVALHANGNKQVVSFNQFVTTISLTNAFEIAKVESAFSIRLTLTEKDSFEPGQTIFIQNSQLKVNDGYYTIKAIEEVPSLELGNTLTADVTDLLITFDQERLQMTQVNGELLIAKSTEIIHNLKSTSLTIQPELFSDGVISTRPEVSTVDQNRITIDPEIPLPGEYTVRVIAGISDGRVDSLTQSSSLTT